MTHEHGDILAQLGVRMPVESNNEQLVSVLSASAPEPSVEQIKEQEKYIELLEAKEKELVAEWFKATAPLPVLAARFVNGKWDVLILEGKEGVEFLDPRRKNLLNKAISIALRRHGRQQQFRNRLSNRKSEEDRQKEVQRALEESKRAGTLSLSPADRL